MSWVTTNIRFPEDLYMDLKMEAARQRKSVAALVREKVSGRKRRSKDAAALLREFDKVARENAKVLKGESLSKLLIEMRYEQ